MTLKVKILKAIIAEGFSIMPMVHCPDGYYEDYDHWEDVETDEGVFTINFYSDGEDFYITAYPLLESAEGWYTDHDTWITIMRTPVTHVA